MSRIVSETSAWLPDPCWNREPKKKLGPKLGALDGSECGFREKAAVCAGNGSQTHKGRSLPLAVPPDDMGPGRRGEERWWVLGESE